MEKIIPSPGRVVISPVSVAEMTEGGIYLPEQLRNRQTRGLVLAVGSEVEHICKHGDVVAYDNFVGEVLLNDKMVTILDGEHVLAIIERA